VGRDFGFLHFGQLAEQLVLPGRELFGDFDIGLNVQIACRTAARIGQTAAADAKNVARLRAGGNFQFVRAG
jgi:hypothetical protein